ALRQMARTFSGESLPSSVVRSSIDIASRSPASLDAVLIERLVNIAVRCSSMTGSTLRLGMGSVYRGTSSTHDRQHAQDFGDAPGLGRAAGRPVRGLGVIDL